MYDYTKGEGIFFLIVAILLFVGVFSIQYDYYILLRVVVCFAAVYTCIVNVARKQSLQFIPLLIAILFNPIVPIYMSKGIWVFFDIITGIYFLSSWSVSRK